MGWPKGARNDRHQVHRQARSPRELALRDAEVPPARSSRGARTLRQAIGIPPQNA